MQPRFSDDDEVPPWRLMLVPGARHRTARDWLLSDEDEAIIHTCEPTRGRRPARTLRASERYTSMPFPASSKKLETRKKKKKKGFVGAPAYIPLGATRFHATARPEPSPSIVDYPSHTKTDRSASRIEFMDASRKPHGRPARARRGGRTLRARPSKALTTTSPSSRTAPAIPHLCARSTCFSVADGSRPARMGARKFLRKELLLPSTWGAGAAVRQEYVDVASAPPHRPPVSPAAA